MRRDKRKEYKEASRKASTTKRSSKTTRKQKDDDGSTLTVGGDVRIPQTDYVLEKGDEIRVYPKDTAKNKRDETTRPKRGSRRREAVANDPEQVELAMKRAFRAEMDIEEMEVEEESGFVTNYYEVESESGSASTGEREWMVFLNDDDAEREAIAQVEEDLDSEPEIFDRDFLMQHVYISDTDRRVIASDEVDAYMEDSDTEEEDVDEVRDNKYNEVYNALEDPAQYFVEDLGAFTYEELFEQPFIRINKKEAAREAVNIDGVAHFLDHYDGEEEEITDPKTGMEFFVYGTN